MDKELILKKAADDNRNILNSADSILDSAMQFQQLLMLYESGIKQITTKFEILENEFQSKHQRNPIETITSRIKEPMSIAEKLQRKGLSVTIDNMVNKLYDIAGIRVTCPFISDVYHVTQMLLAQDDITLIELKDYIKNPKPTGYRSLHLIVKVDVFFSDQKRAIPVEVQIRTIAMDFWASLEHQLHYKKDYEMPANISEELKMCADIIASTDAKMQNLAKNIPTFEVYTSDDIPEDK
ncbi:MAG: GTP pyrophosphokinase family protein [Treponema sp.]